ncbi:MAG: hypothetical protein COB15_11950 [Flavobacteriales bacterium]|nr:MAG: hypothetical protein COB15_11950 [Flavobacteriales bacterium]
MDDLKANDSVSIARAIENYLVNLQIEFTKKTEFDDIYFQVNDKQKFVLSIDIRFELIEVFLDGKSFVMIKNNSTFYKESFIVLKQIINGEYNVFRERIKGKVIRTRIIFDNNIEYETYKSYIYSWLKFFIKNTEIQVERGRSVLDVST